MVKTENEIRQTVREWIVTKGGIRTEELRDDTPIIERRIIKSVHIMDLILFLEKLRGEPIDVERLKVGVFRNVDAIYRNFFADGSRDR